jgi:hypothetical protein
LQGVFVYCIIFFINCLWEAETSVFFQKDYVLRMIEMMGDFMRRIGELLDDLQRMRLLDDTCLEYCGIDLKAAGNLSIESLVELLSPQPRLMLAEILYIRAMQTSLPDEDREQILYRCVRLLLSLKDESLLCELRHERLSECMAETRALLTPSDRMEAAVFFVQAEHFGLGEDQVYEALQEALPEQVPSLLAEGEKLMGNCLQVPPKRLAAGGLPYPEVVESVQTLHKRREALETL